MSLWWEEEEQLYIWWSKEGDWWRFLWRTIWSNPLLFWSWWAYFDLWDSKSLCFWCTALFKIRAWRSWFFHGGHGGHGYGAWNFNFLCSFSTHNPFTLILHFLDLLVLLQLGFCCFSSSVSSSSSFGRHGSEIWSSELRLRGRFLLWVVSKWFLFVRFVTFRRLWRNPFQEIGRFGRREAIEEVWVELELQVLRGKKKKGERVWNGGICYIVKREETKGCVWMLYVIFWNVSL